MKEIEKIAYKIYEEDHTEDYHTFCYDTFLTSDSYKKCYKKLAEKEIRKRKLKLIL